MSGSPNDKKVTEYLRKLGNPYAKLSILDECDIEVAAERAHDELLDNVQQARPVPVREIEKGALRRRLESIEKRLTALRDRLARIK